MRNDLTEFQSNIKVTSLFLLFAAAILLPDMALAGDGSSTVGNVMCAISLWFRGEIAAGVATIAICTIGCLACLGRTQWTTAMVIATGITLLFGSSLIVGNFPGSRTCDSYNYTLD